MSQMQADGPSVVVNTDRPIESVAQDRLGRASFALSVARQIRFAPPGESFVIALVGPWGSGKTSILNMIGDHLQKHGPSILFLRFNPWLFSGHQQLVAHFFQEVAVQLREAGGQELRDVWRGFEGYSRLLRPLRVVVGDEEGKAGTELSVRRQRKLLDDALRKGTHRFVIVIDDIDRLQDEEIRDVMRLVRLVADFPNTVYLLSYDQERVERALGGTGETGRAYLEKIVQIAHHVPKLRESDLLRILIEKINEITRAAPHGPADTASLQDIFHRGIRPLFHGLRDIYRFANALRPTLEQIGDEVALPDVLAMEALRVTHPAVFEGVVKGMRAFLTMTDDLSRSDVAGARKAMSEVIALGGSQAEEIQTLLEMVFPTLLGILGNIRYAPESMKTWRKNRKIACPEVLEVYLARALPEGTLPSRVVREFFESMSNEESLIERLNHMDPMQLEELLERLEDYEDDFRADTVATAVKVLAEQLPRLREGRAGMFDFGADMALSRVILRLLRRVDAAALETPIECMLPRIGSLSARGLIVSTISSHDLVEKQTAARFEAGLAKEVLQASPGQLASERELMRLLHNAQRQDQEGYASKLRELVTHDRALVRMLVSGLSEARSAVVGSGVESIQYGLPWWHDIQRYAGEEVLAENIRAVDARRSQLALNERESIALDAALRYLTGWRPKHQERPSALAGQPDDEEDVSDGEPEPDDEEEDGDRYAKDRPSGGGQVDASGEAKSAPAGKKPAAKKPAAKKPAGKKAPAKKAPATKKAPAKKAAGKKTAAQK